jgi:hypothetical protein
MNRVGFSGTRKGCRKAQYAALKDVLGRELAEDGSVLHSGDCVGCDEEAFMAAASLGRKNILHPPEVGTLRAFCDRLDIVADIETLPALPYIARNRAIVDACDVVVVCPDDFEESRWSGTWSTYRYAMRQKKRTIVVWPDGRMEEKNREQPKPADLFGGTR